MSHSARTLWASRQAQWRTAGMCAVVVAAMALFSVSADVRALQGRWAPHGDKTAQMIVDMEQRWAEADCNRQSVATIVLADDFEGTTPEGRRFDKARAISDAASAPPTRECRLGPVDVRLFTESIAIAYGTSSSFVQGSDGVERKQCLAWTDTWLKRGAAWAIVAAQDTSIDCK
jgi:hypothetical protein